jgi:hypothetical protein
MPCFKLTCGVNEQTKKPHTHGKRGRGPKRYDAEDRVGEYFSNQTLL